LFPYKGHTDLLRAGFNVIWNAAGDSEAATKALEKATALYPQHPKAVLALGSILQDRLDLENALIKYRSATDVNAHSPQVRSKQRDS
jgi:Flp pilus assembly protein TadD